MGKIRLLHRTRLGQSRLWNGTCRYSAPIGGLPDRSRLAICAADPRFESNFDQQRQQAGEYQWLEDKPVLLFRHYGVRLLGILLDPEPVLRCPPTIFLDVLDRT